MLSGDVGKWDPIACNFLIFTMLRFLLNRNSNINGRKLFPELQKEKADSVFSKVLHVLENIPKTCDVEMYIGKTARDTYLRHVNRIS